MLRKNTFKRDRNEDIDVSIARRRAVEFLIREQEAKVWLEEMINEKIEGGTSQFIDRIRDGRLLGNLAKKFSPKSVKKIHTVKHGR